MHLENLLGPVGDLYCLSNTFRMLVCGVLILQIQYQALILGILHSQKFHILTWFYVQNAFNSHILSILFSQDDHSWSFIFVISLFLSLSLCDSEAKNFNLGHNLWTVRDRDFTFGIPTQPMKPFQMTPRWMTLWHWPWPLYYNSQIWTFVAAGGIRVSQTYPFLFSNVYI